MLNKFRVKNEHFLKIFREHSEVDCEVSEVLWPDEVFANLLRYFSAERAGVADPKKGSF